MAWLRTWTVTKRVCLVPEHKFSVVTTGLRKRKCSQESGGCSVGAVSCYVAVDVLGSFPTSAFVTHRHLSVSISMLVTMLKKKKRAPATKRMGGIEVKVLSFLTLALGEIECPVWNFVSGERILPLLSPPTLSRIPFTLPRQIHPGLRSYHVFY